MIIKIYKMILMHSKVMLIIRSITYIKKQRSYQQYNKKPIKNQWQSNQKFLQLVIEEYKHIMIN